MSTFLPIDLAVEAVRRSARSALPDAPVVPDDEPRRLRTRIALSRLLRQPRRRRLDRTQYRGVASGCDA
jgi:hypothetical protein